MESTEVTTDPEAQRRHRHRAPGPGTRAHASLLIGVLMALVLPVIITAGMYLLPFVRNPSLLPFGADTKKYVARAEIVSAEGIQGLDGDTSSIAQRPSVPIFTATMMGLTGSSALTYAWLTPAIVASLIALAVGALATDGLEEPRHRALFYAVGVGCSAFVAWTAYGYAANLLVDPVIVVLFLVALRAATTGHGRLAGAVLLAGSVLTHWVFAGLAAGILLGLAILLMLARLVHWPMRPRAGAGRDVAAIVVGGLVGGTAAMVLSPVFPGHLSSPEPGLRGGSLHLEQRLPAMRLRTTGPLAALGFGLGITDPRIGRRWCLMLLFLWGLLVPVSLVGWYVLDLPTPPYRFAGSALAVPILVVTAAAGIGTLVRTLLPRLGLVVSAGLLVAASVGLAATGADVWFQAQPSLDPAELAQVETLAAYLAAQPPDLQVVVPIRPQLRLSADRIRVGLPVELDARVTTVSVLVAPTKPNAGVTVPEGAAIVWLAAFQKREVPGITLGPGVVLVTGPAPAGPLIPIMPPRAPSPAAMAVLLLAVIGALAAAGSGWAQLVDLSRIGRAAVMPSFGVATLGAVGLGLSRSGVGFDRGGSAMILLVTIAAGWGVVALRRLHPSSPVPPPAEGPVGDPSPSEQAASAVPDA
ncbi:MAG: hypothetical protein ABJC60_06435 [Actinomycetota bacterium]